MKIIDSHCHLNLVKRHQSLEQVINNAVANEISGILNVSVELSELDDLAQQCLLMDNIWMSCGIHPCHAQPCDVSFDELMLASQRPEVIAIGETGLDFFHQPRKASLHQFDHFENHISVAKASQKPLIIHCRHAKTDVIQVLQQNDADLCGGVMHCFAEDLHCAEAALELGFYISFSGIITYKSAQELRKVAQTIPIDRILVETDSPYLSPVPHRSSKNQPAYVRHTLEQLAQLRGLSIESMADMTYHNFQRCFNIKLT